MANIRYLASSTNVFKEKVLTDALHFQENFLKCISHFLFDVIEQVLSVNMFIWLYINVFVHMSTHFKQIILHRSLVEMDQRWIGVVQLWNLLLPTVVCLLGSFIDDLHCSKYGEHSPCFSFLVLVDFVNQGFQAIILFVVLVV